LPTIDVIRNLTPLSIALPPTADPTQMQPPIAMTLSWAQVALVLVMVVMGWRTQRRLRGLTLLCGVGIALLLWMTTPASAIIWETLPLIRYSQFPWRLFGIASLLLALLLGVWGAALVLRLRSALGGGLVLALLLTLTIVYGYPSLYPLYLPDVNPQNVTDLLTFERESGFVATSSFGEYLPIWNSAPPDTMKLAPRFAQSSVIARLAPPPGVRIASDTWRTTGAQLTLSAEQATALTFDWFYFPGWQARLDGQPIALAPTAPAGLITATIPAGTHTLDIWLGETDRQLQGWALSALGLVLAVVGAVYKPHSQPLPVNAEGSPPPPVFLPEPGEEPPFAILANPHSTPVFLPEPGEEQVIAGLIPAPVTRRGWGLSASALLIAIALLATKTLVIDQTDNPIKRERFAQVTSAPAANFADTLLLISSDAPDTTLTSGDVLSIDLYWRLAGERLSTDYTTIVTLSSADGVEYAQWRQQQPGGLATQHWLPGYYLQDRLTLPTAAGLAPGTYTLSVAVYDPASGRTLDVLDA
ncbi:MAG: hypothetical protein H7Y11_05555, partial [Armatimonadetes bacterium]|nr:hypothetical protein [Anaerolineae bacterium]